MELATSQQFGAALLQALGLEGQRVTELTMNLKVNSFVELKVTRLVGVDQMEKAIHELTSYKVELTEKSSLAQTIEALEKEPKPSERIPLNYG